MPVIKNPDACLLGTVGANGGYGLMEKDLFKRVLSPISPDGL